MAGPATPSEASLRGANRCGGCLLAERCGAAIGQPGGPFRGATLVGAFLLTFLLPAAIGLLGAAVTAGDPVRQLLGGAGGLALGMLAARLAMRRRSVALDPEDCFERR